VVTTTKNAYAREEAVDVTLNVMNRGTVPAQLTFPTAQRYDVLIHDAQGRQVWRWSDGKMFAQVLGEETIQPGRRLVYRVRVRDTLAPGAYRVTGVIPAEQALSASASVRID
jgi:hypothetical protein